MTVWADESLPCNRITGRSGTVWFGGRAITQSVDTPPRAADANEPATRVAAGGAADATAPPIADAPATAMPARRPSDIMSRRLRVGMRDIMPSPPGVPAAPAVSPPASVIRRKPGVGTP